jgi:hypothetical protein
MVRGEGSSGEGEEGSSGAGSSRSDDGAGRRMCLISEYKASC